MSQQKGVGLQGLRVSSFGQDKNNKPPPSRGERTKQAKGYGYSKDAKAKGAVRPQKKPGNAPALKEGEQRFQLVLEGHLSDIPPTPRSMVRIFLSSTFSDMRAERNTLATRAYPKLRDFCAQMGLSFQVVDLRWGVTAEATNNHLTTKICLLELENCKKISLGPSCIALIGNRYGYRPLPHQVPVEEFEILEGEAQALGLQGLDVLRDWYKKDDNSIPPAYFLSPVNSKLPHFMDNSPENDKKRQEDVEAWDAAERQMVTLVHTAALSAAEKKKMTEERALFYVTSVTEHEVRNGIINAEDRDLHGLVFLRDMKGLGEKDSLTGDPAAARYKDMITSDEEPVINKDAEKYLNSLRKELASSVKSENVKSYSVNWAYGGVNPDSYESHNEYISKFCDDFISSVQDLIEEDQLAKASVINQRSFYSLYSEVLHHAHFCQTKCRSFCGQDGTLDKIRDYILDPSNRKPLVVYAESGAGKTSVMAKAMSKLQEWLGEGGGGKGDGSGSYVGIIRFLGTSPHSSDAYKVLFGLVGQLADITGTILQPQSYKTMKALASSASRYIRSACIYLKRPVIVFLDSLDQLQDQFDAHSCWWLPLVLPANFKLVVSTLPKEHNILKNLQDLMPEDAANFIKLPLLPDATSREIVEKYLTHKQRSVTDTQLRFMLDALKKSPNPLYLKLLMDEAVTWPSYVDVKDLTLPATVREAISALFQGLETKFGLEFVRGSLGLLTVGLNGLSELELEDALSCMDNVMVETYRFHDPPIPGIVRVPQVMWARLRYDLREYLVERPSQGQTTLFWYHRQFIQVASERYASKDRAAKLHATLFEMYAAENGIRRSITLTHRRNLHIKDADRNTTPQPMEVDNSRKLECLTYHIKHSLKTVDQNIVKKITYCNLKFLRAKAASAGVDKLIQESSEYVEATGDEEVRAVNKFLTAHKKAMNDSLTSAFSMVASIPVSLSSPNLEALVSAAKECLHSTNQSLLIPSFACLAPRTGEPVEVFDGLSFVFGKKSDVVLLSSKWEPDSQDGDMPHEQNVTLAYVDMAALDINKYICEQVISAPCIIVENKGLFYITSEDASLVTIDWITGKVTKTALSTLFSGSFRPARVPKSFCNISATSDAKKMVVSVGSDICVFETASKKTIGQFEAPGVTKITNLHICTGQGLNTIIVSGVASGGDSKGIILFWDAAKDTITNTIETSFIISRGASQVTQDDVFHIAFGNSGSEGLIEIERVKGAERFDQLKVDQPIARMVTSESSQEAMFLIGDSQLRVLDLEKQAWVRTLDIQGKIAAFDVDWEDDKVLVADAENMVVLYNLKFAKLVQRNGDFGDVAHVSTSENHVMVVTMENKVKIWDEKAFFGTDSSNLGAVQKVEESKGSGNEAALNMSEVLDATSFIVTNQNEMITLGRSNFCRIWSLDTMTVLKEFIVDIVPTEMVMAINRTVLAFDALVEKKIIAVSVESCKTVCDTLPGNVLCFTLMKDKSKAVIMVMETATPAIHMYDVKANSSVRKFTINLPFKCVSARVCLTPSERYAVFTIEVTQEEQEAIAQMWTKGGKFPEQRHPCRFSAIDLTAAGTKGMINPSHVFFRLSKVPQLGVAAAPYKGNTVMISSRRWVMFWDIPTGNCDQTIDKASRKTKMYRPNWLGQECQGVNMVFASSPDKHYIAVGSEDGYVFVNGWESGMPVGMKAPSARHASPVNQACFNPKSSILASGCTGGYLKLWDPKTGNCVFSASLGVEVSKMTFTPDGRKLAALISGERGRLLLFDVKEKSS
ncbi:NACHT and WD repeat domain-containing protein 1 [Elysia marginata]|uniref:NACHT and WD repeat domain-containing protein 1 n=1 Tax=Elysia marginata TaxID=1093978 RepID=A0AAV4FM98_9GAST|nr:NACHT and WD repeat domain-containing protein 1 [Elysia marginata]